MPALTLAFAQWAIIGRIATTIIEENHKEYITAGRARSIRTHLSLAVCPGECSRASPDAYHADGSFTHDQRLRGGDYFNALVSQRSV